jgi:hypothetical protein
MFGTPLKELLAKQRKFELLQIGSTGSGKTTRALTATKFGPVYVFDFDGKVQGAARSVLPNASYDPDLVSADSYKEKDFDFAMAKLKELKAIYAAGHTPFATIVVDTFSKLNEFAYVKAMGKKMEIKGAKAEYDEWGVVLISLMNFFNLLQTLPCNIIVNTHVDQVETPEGKTALGVAGQGSFRNTLARRLSDSHYLYLDMGKFNIRAKLSSTLPANSNIDPKYIDKNGNVTVFDLSVFDDFAFKVGK